jgi:hypothetical protein
MTDEELAGELVRAQGVSANRAGPPTAGAAPPVTESAVLPDTALDFERFEEHFASAMVAHGESTFGSPFWRGANAIPSPFRRGLDDGI